MSAPLTEEQLRDWLIAWVNRNIKSVAELGGADPDRPLEELGLSSRDAVSLVGDLEELLDITIAPTLAWEVPTIGQIAAELTRSATSGAVSVGVAETDVVPAVVDDEIAVIGLGCRFPGGANGPEKFWQLLLDGVDAVSTVPEGRWESFVQPGAASDAVLARTTRWGGFLDDVAGFDTEFWGISPREAELTDPQQRILLEVAWEALEHAGVVPDSLRGSKTGVFVGASVSEYSHLTGRELAGIDAWTATGSALSIIANRLSYLLDLRGPSLTVDTACSSSLVALHTACASLRSGESDAAIVGGVNLLLAPSITVNFDLGGALSADGRCKPFSAEADGIVRGEGCGVVVLKRLSQARRDGDRVLAVVRGSAVNSDGRSNGLVAPNPVAQEAVLRAAYAKAGIDPHTVDYIEAHGTGTLLGDPIEAGALGRILGRGRVDGQNLLIGSAKSNIGHLEAAAGMAGVIKTVLALHHGVIPATLHAQTPNPHINFDRDRLRIVTETQQWARLSGRAIAGVSGFGFGGTNAHVVLSEAEPELSAPAAVPDAHAPQALVLAATSPQRLSAAAADLAQWLESSDVALADVAATLALHRGHGKHRAAVVGATRDELAERLRLVGSDDSRVITETFSARATSPVWVFSGYGSQWAGMGAGLLAQEPAFARALDEVSALVQSNSAFDVYGAIESGEPLASVEQSQLAIFCVQIALAELWRSRGLEPAAVIGHSMGEVAAAVVAGGLSLEDGVTVMCVRSRLLSGIDSDGGGGMAVLELSADELQSWQSEYPDVTVAVYASPSQCTVAGHSEQIAALAARVEAMGRDAWVLKVTGAGHSAAVDPILPELAQKLVRIRSKKPTVPVYSTVLDDPRESVIFDGQYWVANARRPVRFTQAVAAAVVDGHTSFLEIAPHPVAATAIARSAPAGIVVVSSLRRDTDDAATFTANAARLRLAGHDVALQRQGKEGSFADIPRINWQHQRFWFTPPRRVTSTDAHPLLGHHVEVPEGGRHLWRSELGRLEHTDLPPMFGAFTAEVLHPAVLVELMIAAAEQGAGSSRHESTVEVSDIEQRQPLVFATGLEVTTSLTIDNDGASGSVSVYARSAASDPWDLYATARVAISDAAVPENAVEVVGESATAFFTPRLAVLAAQLDKHDPAENYLQRIDTVTSYHARALVLDSMHWRAFTRDDVRVPTERLLYGIDLVPAPLPNARPHEANWRLIGSDTAPDRVAAVAEALRGRGQRVSVTAIDDPYDEADVPAGVLYFVEDSLLSPYQTRDVDEQRVLELAGLASRLSEGIDGRVPRLWIITSGARSAADGKPTRPGQAALRSLVRVLALEQLSLRASVLDLDPAHPETDGRLVVSELLADSADDEILWRDGQRFAARLTPLAVTAGTQAPVDPEGSYILSGGLGGLGLVTARWLNEQGARRIVLCSRRSATSEQLAEFSSWSAQVQVISGDITDPAVAGELVMAAVADGAPLRGVAHLAGAALNDQLVGDLTADALASTWSTKIDGAWNLHQAALGHHLDWFVSYSSFAAAVGSPGQVAYATANAWLDAFADWQRAQGIPGRSINWGAWSAVGAAADNTNVLLQAITPDEGSKALTSVLSSGRTSTTVALLDVARALELLPGLAERRFFSVMAQDLPINVDEQDWIGVEGLAAASDGAQQLLARLRERMASVMSARVENLDVRLPLVDMGFDSLMATRAKNAIEHDLGLALPVKLVLQGASLTDLAVHLGGELGLDVSVLESSGLPTVQGDSAETFQSANASSADNTGALQLRPDGAAADYMPPRDPTERYLVLLWQDALGRKPVGVNDDFWALGGTPDMAEQMMQIIAERLGSAPSAEDFFAVPMISEQSAQIREALEGNQGSPVRVLRGTGSRYPLFTFHPAGGPTSVYQPLVSLLDEEQPVYGFERLDQVTTIEGKASRYVELIREIQPHGPYRLLGWSFGGVLAGEVAHQLTEAGEEVEMLARIDTIIPLVDPDQELHDLLVGRYRKFAEYILETYGKTLDIPYDDLATMTEAEHIAIFHEALTSVGVGMPPGVLEHQYTSYADARIAEMYQPKHYDGRVILYRASLHEAIAATIDPRYRRTDEKLGWDEYNPNLEVYRVPGDHISMIDRPNVDVIAEHLDQVLSGLSARTR